MFGVTLLQVSSGAIQQVIFIVGMILVFYLFMIRPQQKKQKEQKNFLSELKKGDMVVTAGGMHGKIISVEEHTIALEIDRGIKVTFEKGSVSKDNTEMLKSAKSESK